MAGRGGLGSSIGVHGGNNNVLHVRASLALCANAMSMRVCSVILRKERGSFKTAQALHSPTRSLLRAY